MKRIVIATDGSDHGQEAVEVGVDLAAESDAAVTVVHVIATPGTSARSHDSTGFSVRWVRDEASRAAAVEHVELDPALTKAGEAAHARGIEPELVGRTGDTVEEIAFVAEDRDADLVVVGSRGHNRMTSALLGSVSRQLLHVSKRPVMIVRGRRDAA